jgi:PAS domain S-box-containing protein
VIAGGREIGGDLEGALGDLNVPSYVLDRDGVVRWLNPAAMRVVGDVRGQRFTAVVAPEDTLRAKEVFARKVFGKDVSTDEEATLVASDGTRIAVEISSCPLRDDGRIVGVFGLVTQHEIADPPDSHHQLTPRQLQILHLLAHGRSTSQIAGELHLAVETVRNHVRHLLRALDAHSRLEAVATARREGVLV